MPKVSLPRLLTSSTSFPSFASSHEVAAPQPPREGTIGALRGNVREQLNTRVKVPQEADIGTPAIPPRFLCTLLAFPCPCWLLLHVDVHHCVAGNDKLDHGRGPAVEDEETRRDKVERGQRGEERRGELWEQPAFF
eukprot:764737-Hanusia_phi.AAC.1